MFTHISLKQASCMYYCLPHLKMAKPFNFWQTVPKGPNGNHDLMFAALSIVYLIKTY